MYLYCIVTRIGLKIKKIKVVNFSKLCKYTVITVLKSLQVTIDILIIAGGGLSEIITISNIYRLFVLDAIITSKYAKYDNII